MKYADMTAKISMEIFGVPDFFIEGYLEDVAIEFFRRSTVWRVIVAVAVVTDTDVYTVTAPTGSAIDRVVSLLRDDEYVLTPSAYAPPELSLNANATKGSPQYYREQASSTIQLYPVPDDSATLFAECALSPARDYGEISDALYTAWGEAIRNGAKGRLLLIPGTEWVNPEKGSYYLELFEKAVYEAQIVGNSGYGRGHLSTKMRP